jgi:IclR family transcriptional regulator, acetate operon repressor
MQKRLETDTAEPDQEAAPSGLLERTLSIIELLAANAHGLQLYEIAERLAIPRSATHRVLTSLVEHGYLRQERVHGAYRLTAKIASLAFSFLAGSGITDFAQPILDRMAAEAGELVRLAIVDGRELVWVAKSQGSPHGLRYDPDMGQVGQLSCSASGIAWLACLSDDEAIALVEKQGYGSRKAFGPRAPETRAALMRHLRQTRKRGFSLVVQTYSRWMNAAAAAIRHAATGEVIGVVVVAGPHMRLSEEKMLGLGPPLMEAARELALAMMATPGLSPRRAPAATNFFGNAAG